MGKLFSGVPLNNLFRDLQQEAIREINSLGEDFFTANGDDTILNHFIKKFSIEIPALDEEARYLDYPIETTSRTFDSYGQSGLRYRIHIPFKGSGQIFNCSPSSSSVIHSDVEFNIQGQEILISFSAPLDKPNAVESIYQQEMGTIRHNIKSSQHDVDIHLQNIHVPLTNAITQRRAILNEKSKVIGSLNIPIKRSSDQPDTFQIPEVRRKASIELKKTSPQQTTPQPTLPEQEYENILKIIHDMSLMIERSPSTFAKMQETELRDIILVQLNGHYEGTATGETFNGNGKTDILIRYQNTNVFIAECKFWTGKKGLPETIDQLLGYTTWRDTKTAIILFHKGNDLSKVLVQISGIVQSNSKYKSRFVFQDGILNNETIFGYKFKHPNDIDKEIFLSVLAFQVKDKSDN